MPTPFARSMRSLEADRFRGIALAFLLAGVLLAAWMAWFVLARVPVYEVTERARLEVNQAVHPVDARAEGRVVATNLVLGHVVHEGDVLIELDADEQRLRSNEEHTRLAALSPELHALRAEIAAEEAALASAQRAQGVALDEARSQLAEADAPARLAEEEASRLRRLRADGIAAEVDELRTRAEAQRRLAAVNSLRLAVQRLERNQQTDDQDRRVRLGRLHTDLARLRGQIATTTSAIERLENATTRPSDDVGLRRHMTTSLPGMAIVLESVSVRAAGHTILRDVSLSVPAGSHVAIVGASGAGKSSLVGLLLGWHRPAAGRILVDDGPLDGETLDNVRRETAWVDPAVQLWNRPLLENLQYGTHAGAAGSLGSAIDAADLREVLERLPDGLQTPLGEGGGSISGGEGQRVRLGRALTRPHARLVILDEPFRGLERDRRRDLLRRARGLWREATMLCITHDVGETLAFNRVVVVSDGCIVEDGAPEVLAARSGSRYRAMLDAETIVRESLWSNAKWRVLTLHQGRLSEVGRELST